VRADSPEHPARIDDRTRAIVLVTPNNPTGATASPTTIAERFELARAHGIALVLDETYAEFRHDSEPAHDLFTRDDWPDTLVRLHSFSKVFALAGYRVGSLVAHPELLRDAVKLADCQTIGAPRIAQHAAAWGLAHLDDWVAARRAEMLAKVDACAAAFAGSLAGTGWELESAGAYFAWIRHPFTGEPARTVARRLADEQALLTIPGECFGTDQDAFVRLAFGNVDLAAVPEVARRLAASTA
jgi:aspartate/methionine/tyrosine aminotransferase